MIRTRSSRVEVLRNGVVLTELKYYTPPNIYADSTARLKTSMLGTFVENNLVDWLTDELRPVLILDGAEHHLGVFRAGSVSQINNEYGAVYKVEAYDRTYMLMQRKTETILHFNAGVNYIAAVETLLAACGIALILSTPTIYTLTTAREDWDVGTSYLDIVNQLLSEINYSNVWFNAEGYAILEPVRVPSPERIDHVFDTKAVRSLLHRDCEIETDFFDKPNVFVVICSNPDLPAPLVAVAENDSPSSAFSTIRRGMKITSVEKVDNIASQAALQEYANGLCNKSMLSSETITVKTEARPGHGIGDTIALVHPDAQGLCEETAWYLDLAAGTLMTHELKKVVYR